MHFDAAWSEEVELRDGTAVTLRLLREDDREQLRQGLARLSDESRYRRFLTAMPKLTAAQLECLAGLAEDYSRGVGHITTRQAMQLYWIPTKEAPLAMARASPLPTTPPTRAVSATVA